MGRLEGVHLLAAGEAMVLKGNVPLLQQAHGSQPPGAGVVRQIHPVEADGMQGGGGRGQSGRAGFLQPDSSSDWKVKGRLSWSREGQRLEISTGRPPPDQPEAWL